MLARAPGKPRPSIMGKVVPMVVRPEGAASWVVSERVHADSEPSGGRGGADCTSLVGGCDALVLGSWGNATRGEVGNKGRWKGRRAPTQDPSTDRLYERCAGGGEGGREEGSMSTRILG